MHEYFHSVTLDKEKCRGCINCIKRCPTEAIRVRNGKAKIIKERCIDCGVCISVCPYHAKLATTDPFEKIKDFKYSVALPAPTFYGQFRGVNDTNVILTALKVIGFNDVYEVARAAEQVTRLTKEYIANNELPKPVISSACPAVVRLIKVRFPSLIKNIMPLYTPVELAAVIARNEAVEKTGLPPEKIGVFFISPCAAKVTSSKLPPGLKEPVIDGVISMKEVHRRIVPLIKKIKEPEVLSRGFAKGVCWASSGGESSALGLGNYISVDGIADVIKFLEEIEDDKVDGIDFVEALSCTGGCVGGPLTVENCFVAKNRISQLTAKMTVQEKQRQSEQLIGDFRDVLWDNEIEYSPVLNLDSDMMVAMQKMEEMKRIYSDLPGLDCGTCGAPSCMALAEDIVRGFAEEGDCIFKMRERVSDLAKKVVELESHLPPPFRVDKEDN